MIKTNLYINNKSNPIVKGKSKKQSFFFSPEFCPKFQDFGAFTKIWTKVKGLLPLGKTLNPTKVLKIRQCKKLSNTALNN